MDKLPRNSLLLLPFFILRVIKRQTIMFLFMLVQTVHLAVQSCCHCGAEGDDCVAGVLWLTLLKLGARAQGHWQHCASERSHWNIQRICVHLPELAGRLFVWKAHAYQSRSHGWSCTYANNGYWFHFSEVKFDVIIPVIANTNLEGTLFHYLLHENLSCFTCQMCMYIYKCILNK